MSELDGGQVLGHVPTTTLRRVSSCGPNLMIWRLIGQESDKQVSTQTGFNARCLVRKDCPGKPFLFCRGPGFDGTTCFVVFTDMMLKPGTEKFKVQSL
eukprot:2776942-Amphidinium_carterae.1